MVQSAARKSSKQLVDMPLEQRIPFLEERIQRKAADLAELEREYQELACSIHQLKSAIALEQQCLESFQAEQDGMKGLERSPIDMLRPEFKGLRMSAIIVQVLAANPMPLTTPELTRLIYDVNSEGEFERARNSLSTELRSGAKSKTPKWRKIGRYAYSALA
jgi:hypothetical protein